MGAESYECVGCKRRFDGPAVRCASCKHRLLPVGSAALREHLARVAQGRRTAAVLLTLGVVSLISGLSAIVFGAWGLGEVLALLGLVLSIGFAALWR